MRALFHTLWGELAVCVSYTNRGKKVDVGDYYQQQRPNEVRSIAPYCCVSFFSRNSPKVKKRTILFVVYQNLSFTVSIICFRTVWTFPYDHNIKYLLVKSFLQIAKYLSYVDGTKNQPTVVQQIAKQGNSTLLTNSSCTILGHWH